MSKKINAHQSPGETNHKHEQHKCLYCRLADQNKALLAQSPCLLLDGLFSFIKLIKTDEFIAVYMCCLHENQQ